MVPLQPVTNRYLIYYTAQEVVTAIENVYKFHVFYNTLT